ncbi:UNVERIFIED_CONTAM: hypothetical protein HDU68_003207 [Siphonaria sp. JEL0065]|nr:hypothetical protein HDU68_003207 [Siphonaria sp. JEL0065]
MEQIEFLIINQLSVYINQAGESLTAITQIQSDNFQNNVWSFSTPERAKTTFKSMLILLNGVRQYTTSMYIQTYPAGEQYGYFYHEDENGTTLRWWSQNGTTVTINLCTPDGAIIQPPLSVDSNPGNGTLENPGNNNTLQNAVGGQQAADLQYSVGNTVGYSDVYLWDDIMYKTSFSFAINSVTKESVTFANDWTLSIVDDAIDGMLSAVNFPMFAAIIECKTGFVLSTSSNAVRFDPATNDIYSIEQIDDPFFRDFSSFINSTFLWNGHTVSINSLPSQLFTLYAYVDEYYLGLTAAFMDRRFNNKNWKVVINTYFVTGNEMLFIAYMDMDSVEAQLEAQSKKTGYMMIGIVSAFVLVGVLFTILITRQLAVVSGQIKLLKDLKFKEVMGGDADIKNRSFIYELAELQKCFYSMVVVFSDLLKNNASMRTGSVQQTGSGQGGPGTARPSARPMSMVDHTKSGGPPATVKEETLSVVNGPPPSNLANMAARMSLK